MPKKYEDIKEQYMKQGKTEKEAERIAAMTYNSQRRPGEKPVTRDSKAKVPFSFELSEDKYTKH